VDDVLADVLAVHTSCTTARHAVHDQPRRVSSSRYAPSDGRSSEFSC
jgi:hypothetical protein